MGHQGLNWTAFLTLTLNSHLEDFHFQAGFIVIQESPITIIGKDILFLFRATMILKPLAICALVARDSNSLTPGKPESLLVADPEVFSDATPVRLAKLLQLLFS